MTTPIIKPVLHSPHKVTITIVSDQITGLTEVKFNQIVNPLWFSALLSQLLNEQLKLIVSNQVKPNQTEAPTNGN